MDRLYENNLTVPARTATTAYVTQQWPLEDAQLLYVQIVIPAGHAGMTGIRLSRSGTQIVPYSRDSWLISDDEKPTFPFNGEITQSGLTVEAYNTDVYDHTFYMRAMIRDLSLATSPNPPPITFIASDVISSPA